ncbi:MAG: haloacid dehalogenase type II [Bacteroidetes bacterium]|nr:haloacid dehalogenase type II [Bacteroidota bacterium]
MNRRRFFAAGASIAGAWGLAGTWALDGTLDRWGMEGMEEGSVDEGAGSGADSVASVAQGTGSGVVGGAGVKVILFDAFPVWDAGGIAQSAERLFPGRGKELFGVWRAKLFEYSWLRSISGSYLNFFDIASDALSFACLQLGVSMSEVEHRSMVKEFYELRTWPEVSDTLRKLTGAGYVLGFLSNFTDEMLRVNARNCGIDSYFSHYLSVDRIRRFKPDPRAYQIGVDTIGLTKEEILFVAFAGWDACGARQFGYPTFWVNRAQSPAEQLGISPNGEGKDLNDLLRYLGIK